MRRVRFAGNRARSPAYVVVSGMAVVALSSCTTSGFENLNDKASLVATAEKQTPLPPGSHFDDARFATTDQSQYATGYFLAMAQSESQCKWYMYWIRGFSEGDKSKMQQASKTFVAMRSWAMYRDTDAGTRQYFESLTQAADLGDPSKLQNFVNLNCQGISP